LILASCHQETDRISPHFGHMIQPLDEGRWLCLTCDDDGCTSDA
jgi:hypothetical protein